MAQGENGVVIEIQKPGNNSRIIRSKTTINASFETVWNILTDYEKLDDVIPALVVCKVIDKKDNFARIHQILQQNLLFGMKYSTKIVLDSFEKEMEISASKMKREIEFQMVEGDFQSFKGKWTIEQVNPPKIENETSSDEEFETTLSYIADIKPMAWLPIRLFEGKISKEIQTNFLCIREKAQKMTETAVDS